MTARQNHYAESLAESSTTSTSYQDKVTLSFTPDDGGTYFILASALFRNDASTNIDGYAQLLNSTSAVVFNSVFVEPVALDDYISFAGLGVETFGVGPGAQTYKLQYKSDGLSVDIKRAAVIAIKADAADAYDESTSEETNQTTTPQTKAEISFTPATPGDYLIVAVAEASSGSGSSQETFVDLDIDGVSNGQWRRLPKDNANYYPWGAIVKVTLSAALHSIKIRWWFESNVAPGGKMRNARVIALRLDKFADAYYAEQRTRATTTSTSDQDLLTLTETPAAEDHLVIASALLDSNSGQSAIGNLAEDGTTQAEMLAQPGDTANNFPFFTLYRKAYAGSSVNWKLRYRADATNTVGMDEGAIAVLELNEAAGGGPVAGTGQPVINITND